MDTEQLLSSLRIACHQPGGKKSISPASRTTDMARGATCSLNLFRSYRSAFATSLSGILGSVFSTEVEDGERVSLEDVLKAVKTSKTDVLLSMSAELVDSGFCG